MAEAEKTKQTSDPFHVHIEILNKEEVISKKVGMWWVLGASSLANFALSEEAFADKVAEQLVTMVPELVMEKVSVEMTAEVAEKKDNKFCLKMQIIDHDLGTLIAKSQEKTPEEGKAFASILNTIKETLPNMGMEDKVPDIDEKIRISVRNGVMKNFKKVLPMQLEKQDIKCTCEIPEIYGVEIQELVDDFYSLREPFSLIVSNIDRAALVDGGNDKQNDGKRKVGHRLKKAILKAIPEKKFNEKVAEKLQTIIPSTIEEKLGVKSTCTRQQDQEKDGNVVVRCQITEFEIYNILVKTKGQAFADNFQNLIVCLKLLITDYGLANLQEKVESIYKNVETTIRDQLGEGMRSVLAEKMCADVELNKFF